MVPPDSHRISRVPRYSGYPWASANFAYRTLTVFGWPSQTIQLSASDPVVGSYNPDHTKWGRFGLFPFRSPLLRESLLMSLPPGTEMFHFPGFAPFRVTGHDSSRVSPFGNPRIKARFLLPAAYRRLLRPSSPLCAKASAMCP